MSGLARTRGWDGPILPDHYFAADDVGSDAGVLGLIAMHFACFGAGVPGSTTSGTSRRPSRRRSPRVRSWRPARRLLSHPKGGALAVVGHVDRAWGYSFNWREAGPQLQCFEDALKEMMRGQPVGAVLESLNQRYADLSSALSKELQNVRYGKLPDVEGLVGMWTANNDARSYIIIGDPAARLPMASDGGPAVKWPVIEAVILGLAGRRRWPQPGHSRGRGESRCRGRCRRGGRRRRASPGRGRGGRPGPVHDPLLSIIVASRRCVLGPDHPGGAAISGAEGAVRASPSRPVSRCSSSATTRAGCGDG